MASQEFTFPSSANHYSVVCRICEGKSKNLHVLSCLHVICEGCLKKMQENETFNYAIKCQVCGQETELSSKDVSRLPLASLSCNRIDLKAIDIEKNICGSCKTGGVAVGHCTDCASSVCQNCYKAHKIMYYFQNHQVISFEDIKRNEEYSTTQTNMNCKCYLNEILKYYCYTCNVVRKQSTSLINISVNPDITVGMMFETDKDKFETTINEKFGHIKKSESPAKMKESPYYWKALSVNFTSSFDSDNSNFFTEISSSPNSLPQIDVNFNNKIAKLNLIKLANLENRKREQGLSSFSSSTLLVPVSENKHLINCTQPDVTTAQFDKMNYSTALFNRGSISLSNSLPTVENNTYNPKPRRSGIKPKTMRIRCIFGQTDSGKAEFKFPNGFCLGLKEEIIVADTNNHQIKVFQKHDNVMHQFGTPGINKGRLCFPRKVAVIQSTESFVICDKGNPKSRMQIFTKSGDFLKEINIRYVSIISRLVTTEDAIIIVDNKSRVFVISFNGDLLSSFDCSDYIKEPSDIAVYQNEFYICDFKGHCVAVFSDNGNFLRKFGSKCLTKYPTGIYITSEGDVLVADSHRSSYHIAIFSQQGVLQNEFKCSYIKVNLCCGLKVTSEGCVITVAKDDHQVLVFDPLDILSNTAIKSSSVDVNRILK